MRYIILVAITVLGVSCGNEAVDKNEDYIRSEVQYEEAQS